MVFKCKHSEMVPLRVILVFVLAIVRSGGEVKLENHQRILESPKGQEIGGRMKEQEEAGRRSSRDLGQFKRPTTLQRMLEEASCYLWMVSIQCQSVTENSKHKRHHC